MPVNFIGGHTPAEFLGFVFWALLGAWVLMQTHANSRNVKSYRSPVRFSYSFFFSDNARRLLFNLVAVLVAIRFFPNLFGKPIDDWAAFLVGFSSDGIAILLNKFRVLPLVGTSEKPAPDAGKQEVDK